MARSYSKRALAELMLNERESTASAAAIFGYKINFIEAEQQTTEYQRIFSRLQQQQQQRPITTRDIREYVDEQVAEVISSAQEGPLRRFEKCIAFQNRVPTKGGKVRIFSFLGLDVPSFVLTGGIERFNIDIKPAVPNATIGYEYQLQLRSRDNTRWVKSNDWYDLGTRLSHVVRHRNLNARLKENTYRIRIRAYYLSYKSPYTMWQSVDVNSLSENVTVIQSKVIVIRDRIITQGN